MRHIVLLRGVNLGARNRVGMADLRAALAAAGFRDVRTLLQSGNVVLDADLPADGILAGVAGVLRERFGLDTGVVVRDEAQLRAIVADNPLAGVATDGSRQFVAFLSEPHDPAALPEVVDPDRLVARPTELHLWCPVGLRESRLMTALARRPPAPVVTVRNWNTVGKLAAMLDAPDGA